MLRRTITHRSRDRRRIQATDPARPADATPTVEVGTPASTVILTTDLPMALQTRDLVFPLAGIVEGNSIARTVLAIEQVTLLQWRLVCDAVIAAPLEVTIPADWPALRTTMGGFIAAGVYTPAAP